MAITFDDGPEPTVTPLLLTCLAELEVRCTFFLLGVQAARHPELIQAIRAGGHEIALHGEDHRRITSMSHRGATRYLRQARSHLELMAGVPVRYYRPPFGSQSLKSYLAVRRAGLEVVVWSADALDWVDRPVTDVATDGLAQLQAGGILLLHERLEPDPGRGAPRTTFDRVELARQTIIGARTVNWQPCTVGALVADKGAQRSAWFRP